MPTAARLVAALMLAALGWLAADLVKPYLDEGRPRGLFSETAAGVGLLVGWLFMGRRLDKGHGAVLGIGLSGAALLAFWTVFVTSGAQMVERSLRRGYDGPVDAIQGLVAIALDDLVIAAQAEVIGALGLGGLVAAALTRWVGQRFR